MLSPTDFQSGVKHQMAIIHQLGIDHTLAFQFFIFVFTLLVLVNYVFKPYAELNEKRVLSTKGSEDITTEIQRQSDDLKAEYETRARKVSGEIKTIFDSYRAEASQQFETIVATARAEGQKVMEQTRKQVAAELSEAAKQMQKEVPALSQAMSQKLLSNKQRANS